MSSFPDSFTQPGDDSVASTGSTRPFDDDGYQGYDPRLPSQRFDSFAATHFADSDSLKDSATDSPIFHNNNDTSFSAGDDAVASRPVSEIFALREWRRENAILLEEKEKREKEVLSQIIDEADEFKVDFYRRRKVTCEQNIVTNREKEKIFLANQEKFHAEADKNYWKAIAELVPNEVPAIEKKRGKKDQEKKPSVAIVQGPKPGKPTDLSRMRQIILKLKHNTPPHLKPSPPAPAPAKDAKTSCTAVAAEAKAAADVASPEAVAAA